MTSLGELQREIAGLRRDRGFTSDAARILSLLIEELGEVAREVKKTWSPNYEPFDAQKLAPELADVFGLVAALASTFDIDLEAATRSKFFGLDQEREWRSRDCP